MTVTTFIKQATRLVGPCVAGCEGEPGNEHWTVYKSGVQLCAAGSASEALEQLTDVTRTAFLAQFTGAKP